MVTFLPRMLLGILVSSVLADSVTLGNDPASSGDEAIAETAAAEEVTKAELKSMAQRALALLEAGSAGSAEQRICFTCHSQSHPVLAIVEAKRRGFSIDEENLATQVRHTAEHLNRGRKEYLEGRGQGGKSDTAGYALWTLQAGDFANPETTGPVVDWLLSQQLPAGNWKRSSDRPPSEASHFATTYVALKGILDHATSPQVEVAAAEATESGVAEPSGDSQPVDEAEPAAS
jgi:N-acyl-D-amino-acid deacylase